MRKLEIDIQTLALQEVSRFTEASGFFQRPGDCLCIASYFPDKEKIAVEVSFWSTGKFHSLKIRHSLNYCRSFSNPEADIYINLQDGIFNDVKCYINVNRNYKNHSEPPKLLEIKKAWPDSLPKLSILLKKIGEYLNEREIIEFIPQMELIETRGTKHNATRKVHYL